MRLGCLLLIAATGLLAIGDTAAISESTLAYPGHELIENRKRALRSTQYEKGGEDGSDDLESSKDAADSDDEEERDLIISTINRPKYWRWFHAGMTPYTVKEVLGLTGVRRLWKPIKRREYEGYVVFYDEHCRMPKYKSFCRAHAGV
ncbi:avirulence protein 1b [Phytophthora sojae]|uniref:RxLR effector protein n=2 Tax=Phytophthora sojae TaxID=67593 RepID=G4ZYW7_PHYSP|nr:avirulence protein 1b [Phytophthora sojae]AEK80615.1 Avh77 [Phytophthora sojae]AEK80617.1 Avh77 [Phytophthora sojae]EGZ12150.1 avirulence protein 1b [Phytophthora sojae]|eukprot:XP_009532483.1 avirulence protein 1b [Phytophthora sojae]